MFQLLQPIWLFAIGGIVVPIVIHLWNIRKGKTLLVGSILLLRERARQQARGFRLRDIWLLLLRCVLIIVLVFLIAKPEWKRQLTAINEKGWILIEKGSLHESYKNYKPEIDSLIKAGYKFHYFNKGFEADKPGDALKKTVDKSTVDTFSYWVLLKELNEELPLKLPVYLFTDNKLKRFSGGRPKLSINLHWNTYTSGDTLAKTVVKAYTTATDSIRMIIADSKPASTFYTSEVIRADKDNASWLVKNGKGKIVIKPKDNNITDDVEVDTSTLKVIIYTDDFTTDAMYLKAAIDAIQKYAGLKINTSITSKVGDIQQPGDWLFWLSEKALPLQQLQPNTFLYEKGKEQQINSWIITGNNFPVNIVNNHLSRIIENNDTIEKGIEPLWKDGFGHTLLIQRNMNSWHFYSRFNPYWSDLVWSPQFVESIFDLLIKPGMRIKNLDERAIDTFQLQPEKAYDVNNAGKQGFVEKKDLTKLFWIIAFIIFSLERYISFISKKREVYA